jgi:hypothetical protein
MTLQKIKKHQRPDASSGKMMKNNMMDKKNKIMMVVILKKMLKVKKLFGEEFLADSEVEPGKKLLVVHNVDKK